jgi:dihydroxyacid dehydratase/phosphogluconate dehydratase
MAAVREGDSIYFDLPGRRLEVEVEAEELAGRVAGWTPPSFPDRGGYFGSMARPSLLPPPVRCPSDGAPGLS